MAAMRDLGALPPDTDLDAVIRDLRLDQPTGRPDHADRRGAGRARCSAVVKALLGYGARMPKELMLYVKNMVFLDGAMARLAPDLDLLGEIAKISMMFAERHGERLGRELGIDHTAVEINMDGVKAGFGVDASTDPLTYRELQARRELIQKRMRDQVVRRVLGSRSVRLVIARCRSTTRVGSPRTCPRPTRLIMVKADGCVAIHADGGAYKPLNWMNAPNMLVDHGDHWTVTNPKGEQLTITLHEVLRDSRHELGDDPGSAEGRRRGAPAGAARRRAARDRGGPHARAPRVPDGDRADRPGVPRRDGTGRRDRGQAPRRDRRRRAARPATSSGCTSTPRSAPCAACSSRRW